MTISPIEIQSDVNVLEEKKKRQRGYVKKNQAKLDQIVFRVPKGLKNEYRQLAENAGKSLQQFIIDCIENSRNETT